jgi:hypothetical protein
VSFTDLNQDSEIISELILKQATFFEAAGAVAKIVLILNQTTIEKFSVPKLVKHTEFTALVSLSKKLGIYGPGSKLASSHNK